MSGVRASCGPEPLQGGSVSQPRSRLLACPGTAHYGDAPLGYDGPIGDRPEGSGADYITDGPRPDTDRCPPLSAFRPLSGPPCFVCVLSLWRAQRSAWPRVQFSCPVAQVGAFPYSSPPASGLGPASIRPFFLDPDGMAVANVAPLAGRRLSGRDRSSMFEGHSALQRCGSHLSQDRHGPSEPHSVDASLGGLLDQTSDDDRQVRCAME